MNTAPHLVDSEFNLASLPLHPAIEGDAVFHLPLARSTSSAGTLAITLTNEDKTRQQALALINRRYAWRGYGSDHNFSMNCSETTFTAHFNGSLIGTVTLAADSDKGLSVDATFPAEMQFFRRKPNARLCELKKLAMETKMDSKPVLAALFHFVFIFGTNNWLGTDLLIEVNPRHALFYEKMLGFRQVGGLRTNASVSAPSQLMWLAVSDIEASIDKCQNTAPNNSFYKYFYPRVFEDRIVNQLTQRGLREHILKERPDIWAY